MYAQHDENKTGEDSAWQYNNHYYLISFNRFRKLLYHYYCKTSQNLSVSTFNRLQWFGETSSGFKH